MGFEFDTAKDKANIAKHGVSVALGRVVIENRARDVVDPRHHSEVRRIAYGMVNGRMFVCVYTMRGETYWLISVRKANSRERKKWQP